MTVLLDSADPITVNLVAAPAVTVELVEQSVSVDTAGTVTVELAASSPVINATYIGQRGPKGDPGDPGSGAVSSVNEQTGDVALTAAMLGAATTTDVSDAITALDLGTASTHDHSDYDAAGSASTAQAAAIATAATDATTKVATETSNRTSALALKLDANDASVTNSRTPTGSAGGDLTGTYPNPTLAVARALASRTITAGTGLTGGGDLTADRTLTVAYGTTSTTAAVGNDARLSDTRTPTDSTVTAAKLASDLTGIQWRPVELDVITYAPTGTQNTWNLVQNSSAFFGGYRGNTSTPAVNDYLEWTNVYIPAGTFTIALAALKGTTTAIATVLIDGSSVGTADTYTSGSTAGDVFTITGVAITAGLHTIQIKAATKNAAGTATYLLRPSRLTFRRTA